MRIRRNLESRLASACVCERGVERGRRSPLLLSLGFFFLSSIKFASYSALVFSRSLQRLIRCTDKHTFLLYTSKQCISSTPASLAQCEAVERPACSNSTDARATLLQWLRMLRSALGVSARGRVMAVTRAQG